MTTRSLQERISGTVVHRGDPDYEQARGAPGWNEIKPERYPDLIVQVASEDDVIKAVNFAREQHMKIGIRGGGHNWCAAALQLNTLVELELQDVIPFPPLRHSSRGLSVSSSNLVGRRIVQAMVGFCG